MTIDTTFLKKYDCAVYPEMGDIDLILTNKTHVVLADTVIEPDDWTLFWKLWNELKEPMNDSRDRTTAIWETLGIYRDPHTPVEKIVETDFSYPWTDWSTVFPQMFEHIRSTLPYKIITHVTLCSSIKPVIPHIDPILAFYPWPNCLRVMLHDENECPTFYLTPWTEKYLDHRISTRPCSFKERYISFKDTGKKMYVELPKTSNTFVFSNGEYLHGADYHGKNKIMMLVHGEPDAEGWKKKLRAELQQ